jgi:hypothetical protein
MEGYKIGIDHGVANDIYVEERYMFPTAEYPQGSWLYKVGDDVKVATGCYALEYPNKPSPYWHGGAPFVMIDTKEWGEFPWAKPNPSERSRES